MNLGVNVEALKYYQSCEGDGNQVGEAVLEENHREQYDGRALQEVTWNELT